VWLFYGVRDFTETKVENFRNVYIDVNPPPEGDDQYADSKIKKIYSRWITAEGIAVQTAGRLLALYESNIKIATFRLDNKDDIMLGDQIVLDTRFIQDDIGNNKAVNMIVTEDREIESGSIIEFKAQQFELIGRFGFIGYSHKSQTPSNITTIPPTLKLDPDVADRTVSTNPDVTLDGDFIWPTDILIDHILHMHFGAAVGQTRSITAYNSTTKRVTFNAAFNPNGSIGDVYEIHLPEYTGSYMLKEDGDALLLEGGGFITLESASITGATESQKQLYTWISPDSGFFDDGTEAYKIL